MRCSLGASNDSRWQASDSIVQILCVISDLWVITTGDRISILTIGRFKSSKPLANAKFPSLDSPIPGPAAAPRGRAVVEAGRSANTTSCKSGLQPFNLTLPLEEYDLVQVGNTNRREFNSLQHSSDGDVTGCRRKLFLNIGIMIHSLGLSLSRDATAGIVSVARRLGLIVSLTLPFAKVPILSG